MQNAGWKWVSLNSEWPCSVRSGYYGNQKAVVKRDLCGVGRGGSHALWARLCLGFLGLEQDAPLSGRQRACSPSVTLLGPLLGRCLWSSKADVEKPDLFITIVPSLALGILQAEWGIGIWTPPKGRPEMNLNGRLFHYRGQAGFSPAPAGGFKQRSPCLQL